MKKKQCGSNFHLCKYNILICFLHYFERHKVSSLLHTDQICSLDTFDTKPVSTALGALFVFTDLQIHPPQPSAKAFTLNSSNYNQLVIFFWVRIQPYCNNPSQIKEAVVLRWLMTHHLKYGQNFPLWEQETHFLSGVSLLLFLKKTPHAFLSSVQMASLQMQMNIKQQMINELKRERMADMCCYVLILY